MPRTRRKVALLMYLLEKEDVGMIGRQKNVFALKYDKSIVLTSDILKTKEGEEVESITIDAVESKMEALANDIVLASMDNTNPEYSSVYGERLNELLKWIIKILKTHQHPPNNIPINTFFYDADNWTEKMDDYLLNKRVRTR